jgi:hypothetical protein
MNESYLQPDAVMPAGHFPAAEWLCGAIPEDAVGAKANNSLFRPRKSFATVMMAGFLLKKH